MSYIPSDDDEYRQKDKVRWRRLLHKLAYKLYNKLLYSTITMNYFQLVSLLLFTVVLSSITAWLFATQYFEWLYANTPP